MSSEIIMHAPCSSWILHAAQCVEYLFHQPISPVRKTGIDLNEVRARIQGGQCVIGTDDTADSDDGKPRTQLRTQLPDDAQRQGMQGRTAQSAALRIGPVGAETAQVGGRIGGN